MCIYYRFRLNCHIFLGSVDSLLCVYIGIFPAHCEFNALDLIWCYNVDVFWISGSDCSEGENDPTSAAGSKSKTKSGKAVLPSGKNSQSL